MKKYVIMPKDEFYSGSGCDEMFDSFEDAEFHMKFYSDKERQELVIVEIII